SPAGPRAAPLDLPLQIGFSDSRTFGLVGIKLSLVILQFDEAIAQGGTVARLIEISDDCHCTCSSSHECRHALMPCRAEIVFSLDVHESPTAPARAPLRGALGSASSYRSS